MQQILNVITPATATPPASPYDLVTLDQMKMKLMIPSTNTQWDPLLTELITNLSDQIARLCIRVFAYEQVDETFYQLEDDSSQRLYLSRWPVKMADITALTQDGVDITPNFANGSIVLEEATGTLYAPSRYISPSGPACGSPWYGVIDVQYSGGYKIPTETPGALQFAVEALLRESYMSWIRNPSVFGVRQIAHKESRIGYYGPNMFPILGLPETWNTVKFLLQRFIRQWV